MRLFKLLTLSIILGAISGSFSNVSAQEKGNKNVIIEERELSSFNGIDAGGAISVEITKSGEQSVKIETDENYQKKVTTTVTDGVLKIETKGLKNPTKLKAYVTMPQLKYLHAHGASDVKSESLFEADEMEIVANGATSAELNIDVEYLESSVSGAADLTLLGRAKVHHLEVSGAGSLEAKNLETEKAVYAVSGAGDAFLNVTGEMEGTTKGAADVRFIGDPQVSIVRETDDGKSKKYDHYTKVYNDSTKVKVGPIKVEVYEGDDSVKVIIGNRVLHVDEDGNVKLRRCRVNKFNGHWAGFEMGINGYVNSDFNMSFPKETEYMDQKMTNSWAVHINFFEQNIALAKNQKWGLVTGLGTNWNNYRFSKDTRLNSDSSELIGYIDQGISIRKTKLTTWYLNIPLLFEFQTNRWHKKNSFHIGVGMIMAVRLKSFTKKYYDERNKEFEITRYNTETDQYEVEYTATSPDYSKAWNKDDFYLRPIKWDATVRIGWGFINLFATYSVNSMFKDNKGPELYPWTAGITFVNF